MPPSSDDSIPAVHRPGGAFRLVLAAFGDSGAAVHLPKEEPMSRKLGVTLFGLATLAALGFGATQALAGPTESAERACATGQCRKDCIAQGNSGGICIDGSCICFIE